MKRSRAPFLFLRLLCVLLTDLKNNWHYCSKGNLQQNTHFKFYIDVWYLIVTQAENTPSTATVGINITQQNPTLKLVLLNSKWTPSTVKEDQIRCSKCRPLAFTQAHQWKLWSPKRMLGNDVAVFVREFSATHSLQQWVLAHDASSNADERYGIPKSHEFLSLVKFYAWFCDSLVTFPNPDSKSIHWQNKRCKSSMHALQRRPLP